MNFLIDEDLSPLTAKFLESKGHDVKLVRDHFMGAEDRKVVELAIKEDRTIITQDKDFGNIYYFSERGEITVVVVRPTVQSVDNVNKILDAHLDKLDEDETGLYILQEEKYRVLR